MPADDDELRPAEAAEWSGYSENYLAKLCRAGELTNVGRRYRPRYRRGDLPRKGVR